MLIKRCVLVNFDRQKAANPAKKLPGSLRKQVVFKQQDQTVALERP